MREALKFYIDGQWVDPKEGRTMDVINPASEQPIGRIAVGYSADIIAVEGSPLQDATVLEKVEWVMVRGRVIE